MPRSTAFAKDANSSQLDDGDGDVCASTPLDQMVDPGTGCSLAQLCPCSGPRGTTAAWKNHGQFVSCVSKTAGTFLDLQLITKQQHDAVISEAGRSICGNPR